MRQALVVGNGYVNNPSELKEKIDNSDLIIAVDGGYKPIYNLKKTDQVDLLVGDFDSLNPENYDLSSLKVEQHPQEKDRTDLELALDKVKEKGIDQVIISGGIGNRLDHSLANVHLLEKLANWKISSQIVTENETVHCLFPEKDLNLEIDKGKTVSLIPLTETVEGIETSGLKWELNTGSLSREKARGVSNVVNSPKVSVKVKQGKLLVIINRKI